MDLFPAIDLQNGRCVRLARGDFRASTLYAEDPVAQAKAFAEAGARWIHVVDLDGAEAGGTRQTDLIAAMTRAVPVKIQTGGGIRSWATIDALVAAGVERIVIGSLAVTQPELVREWMTRLGPGRIVLALDVCVPDEGVSEANAIQVVTHGWQARSSLSLEAILAFYPTDMLSTILCTDVARDGMLAGPNLELYRHLTTRSPNLQVLASGGVRSLDDLLDLQRNGLAGAIVGKALYEGLVDLKTAQEALDARN